MDPLLLLILLLSFAVVDRVTGILPCGDRERPETPCVQMDRAAIEESASSAKLELVALVLLSVLVLEVLPGR